MATTYPKLKEDLVLKRQVMSGEVTYLIKNRETNEYVRFREMDWAIISQLDGNTGFEQMADVFCRKFPDTPVDAGQIEDYVDSLKKKGIVQRSAAEQSIVILEKLQEERKKRAESSQAKDVFNMTLATMNPQKFYTAIYPYLRWIWTPAFVVTTLCMFAAAATVLILNWHVVREGMLKFWSFQGKTTADIVMLICILAVIIAIHESAHALTCMNFGGEVTELGFMLMFFIPAFYANVSDAYLFDKKWHKYWVTLAGGYSELIICSLAVFTWLLSPPDTFIYHVAYNVMVFAGISTIVFNYNPLIKLDGYYLLSDILEVSNLRENSTKYLMYLLKRHVWRVQAEPPMGLTPRKKRIYLIYSIFSTLYIITIVTLFVLFVFRFFIRNFPDVGLLLGIWAAYMILKKRVHKLMTFSRFVFLDKRDLFKQRAKLRRVAMAGAAVVLILLVTPLPRTVNGTVVLESAQRQALRAESAGFVTLVADRASGSLAPGEVVVQLRNQELNAQRRAAQAQVDLRRSDAARALDSGDVAAYQAALRQQRRAATELAELERRESALGVRAPFSGEVLSARLTDLVGRHVAAGDTLLEFGAIKKLRARIRLTEFRFREVTEGQEVRLKFNTFPGETFTARLAARSQASPDAYDAAGRFSGDVRKPPELEVTREGAFYSHFEAIVEIDNPEGKLRPGMAGLAKISLPSRSVLGRIFRSARDLVRSRVWW